MSKRILVLGGSKAQEPMIVAAKNMQLEVICADMYPDAYCRNIADYFENVSTLDECGIDKIIEKYHVDGITTCSSDRPMPLIAKLSDKHHLKSISYQAALNATNKAKMRSQLAGKGIPMPRFEIVKSYQQLCAIIDEFKLPIVLKPTDNSGSRGVVLVKNQSELEQQYNYCKSYANSSEILIEEYIVGDEISVESFVVNGINHIIQITDKITTGAPHFVEMGHTQPSIFSVNVKDQLNNILQLIVENLGICCGPTHAEFVIRDNIPILIEIGARLGGDNITTSLVPLSTGISMVKLTIEALFSNEINIPNPCRRGSAIRFINYNVAKKIDALTLEKLQYFAGFEELYLDQKNLLADHELTNSSVRCGYIIASGISREQAVENIEAILSFIELTGGLHG